MHENRVVRSPFYLLVRYKKNLTMPMNILNIILVIMLAWVGSVQAESDDPSALNYFSSNYQEARNKFLDAAHATGARIESIQHPVISPEGIPLFVDVVSIGAEDSDTILVLGSGTHGVEGFAGSGIQTGLLQQDIASALKPGTGLVMIHGINPYGFAHLRRMNEDNVDLNRNFVDHGKPHPTNHGYHELAKSIAPEHISFWRDTLTHLSLFWYRIQHGKDDLQQAITGGQYAYPQGLFYGGNSAIWSNKTVRTIARHYLAKAKRVVFVDIHTGLGPYGIAELILNVPEDSPAFKHAEAMWGHRVKSTVSGEAVSEHLHGTLKLALPRMLPNAEVTAVSLEFGTYPAMEVFWALRSENWLYHHGGKENTDAEEIKADLLRVFYPNTPDWKQQVWEQGRDIVEQALGKLQ